MICAPRSLPRKARARLSGGVGEKAFYSEAQRIEKAMPAHTLHGARG